MPEESPNVLGMWLIMGALIGSLCVIGYRSSANTPRYSGTPQCVYLTDRVFCNLGVAQ